MNTQLLDTLKQARDALEHVAGMRYSFVTNKIAESAITNLTIAIEHMEKQERVPKSKLPERIYLQADEDEWYGDLIWKEVTWSADQVNDYDLCFVREDLIQQDTELRAAAQAVVEGIPDGISASIDRLRKALG